MPNTLYKYILPYYLVALYGIRGASISHWTTRDQRTASLETSHQLVRFPQVAAMHNTLGEFIIENMAGKHHSDHPSK
jgi:hypothetical protein